MVRKLFGFGLPLVLLAYLIFAAVRPMPVVRAIPDISTSNKLVTAVPNIAWTGYGEQAVGVAGSGVLATYGSNAALPIASVAKVMVALAVLKQKPLSPGEEGPNVPITESDVELYQNDLSQGQSVAAVAVGEQLSEFQALEALLLPSANNLATTLTNWAYGSQSSYLSFANSYAKGLGMTNTDFTDASGFSPSTVSTASDLVLLGETAMQNPVIKQIVGTYTADVPVAGTVTNVNANVAPDSGSGLNGIKTGNTDQAGGCLLFSSDYNGHTLVGAIVGAPDLGTAVHDGPEIMRSFKSMVQVQQVVKQGQVVAHYDVPWAGRVDVTANQNLSVVDTVGSKIPTHLSAATITSAQPGGHKVGTIYITFNNATQSTPVALNAPISGPSFWWRVTHP